MDEQIEILRAPRPPAELDRLKSWFGRWTAEERYEKNEYMPDGGTAHGVAEARPGPGGILIEEYRSSGSPLGPYDGFLVMTWDGKEYVCYWFDSFNARGTVARGHWKGDRLVFKGKGVGMNGSPYEFRMTYDVKPDVRLLTSENGPVGGHLKKMFEFEYRRASVH